MDKLTYEEVLKNWKEFEKYLVETRYGMRDPETGELLEHTYDDVIERVIRTLKERTNLPDEVYEFLIKRLIIPASPVLMNLGSPRKNKTYFSCFPLGQVEDTMDNILETAVRMAKIYKAGGGVGIDVSLLRPRGSFVDNKQGFSSGPVGFLPLYDAVTGVVSQANSRRGALLVSLDCRHPDTPMFAKCKWDKNVKREIGGYNLNNMNISLMVWNRGDLLSNKEIFDLVVDGMYFRGDPGLLFPFNQNEETTSIPMKYEPYWVNPCGEYMSVANTSCSLITVSLPNIYREAQKEEINPYELIYKASYHATMIMSAINTFEEGYPDDLIKEKNEVINPVGIGITGLHGFLIYHKIPYYHKEALEITEKVFQHVFAGCVNASASLGGDKKWNKKFVDKMIEIYRNTDLFSIEVENEVLQNLKKNRFHNYTVTTQMPTGTVSQFAYSAATGIEPLYAPIVERKVRDMNNNWKTFKIAPLEAVEMGIDLDQLDKETSLCLSGYEQIDMLSTIIKYQTTNISKTINIPHDFPKDEIKDLIQYAMEKGLKGLTVFRDQSALQVLKKVEPKKIVVKGLPDVREGKTYKFRGPVSLYIIVNKHENKIQEVFLNMGKAGTTLSTLNKALGRVISVALQNNPELVDKFIDTLEGMLGDLTLINSEIGMVTSVPDALAKVLKNEKEDVGQKRESSNLTICPNCGKISLRRSGGCNTCLECGYSSC